MDLLGEQKRFPKPQLVHFAELSSKNEVMCLMLWPKWGPVPKALSPLPGPGRLPRLPRPALSNSLQQLSLGAARRPPDRLLAAPPHPWPAAAPASLYMYKLPINRTAAIML